MLLSIQNFMYAKYRIPLPIPLALSAGPGFQVVEVDEADVSILVI